MAGPSSALLACSIKPCPCCLPVEHFSQSNRNVHPPGWVAKSLGGGIQPFSGVPSQSMGAQSTCCPPVPLLALSILSLPQFPVAGNCQKHPGWLLLIPMGRWGCSRHWNTAPGRAQHPQDGPPSSPRRAVQNELDNLCGTRIFIVPALGKGTWGDHAEGQPAWGWAGGGSAGAGGGTGMQDRDSGALAWAGTWVQWFTCTPSWHSPLGRRFSLHCTSWSRGPAGTGFPSSTGYLHPRSPGHWRSSRCRWQPPALSSCCQPP